MIPKQLQIDFICISLKISLHNKSKECHTNARVICKELKKLGHPSVFVTGIYDNPPKTIRHSWIECGEFICETDCKQLREEGDLMPNEFCAVLPKEKFIHRYKVVEA